MGTDLDGLSLTGKRILVVEDRFLLADDLRRDLSQRGADVVGPASTIERGRALAEAGDIDLAVLDIDLRGRAVYALAEEFMDRRIPVVFASGLPKSSIPKRWAGQPFVAKPISIRRLVVAIDKAMNAATATNAQDRPVL